MADTVIDFEKAAASVLSKKATDTAFRLAGTDEGPPPVARRKTRGAGVAPIEIDQLYPATEGAHPELLKALGLLADAIALLDQARVAALNNALDADRLVQRVQVLLPTLFTCRRLGDGYGLVINSLHFAFINLRGKPLSKEQINAVWRVLKELRNRPFLTFEQALNCVSEFEEVRLEVDPTVLSELVCNEEGD